MRYEHRLCFTVSAAEIAAYDTAGSLIRAREALKDRDLIEIRQVKVREPPGRQIDVIVFLPSDRPPDDGVSGLILGALGLTVAAGEPVVSLTPPVPAPETALRGSPVSPRETPGPSVPAPAAGQSAAPETETVGGLPSVGSSKPSQPGS